MGLVEGEVFGDSFRKLYYAQYVIIFHDFDYANLSVCLVDGS